MGKSTRKKLEETAAREKQFADFFASQKSGKTYRGVITADGIIPKYVRRFSKRQLRNPSDWVYKGKSKKIEKQRIALVRYLYAKYPVPACLENAFISENPSLFNNYARWYLALAQGESLYKTCTREILTKKETHYITQAPNNLNIEEAVWWAKGMALTQNTGIAYRIAKSPIGRADWAREFWIDIHRFFANNLVPLKEMEELIDYIRAAREDNPNWTIKKRSLDAIRRQSEVWHRDMIKLRNIGGGSWDGMNVPYWKRKTGKPDPNPSRNNEVEWHIFEICSGNELAKEGNTMRHCIAGYKSRCITGSCSIFSMRSNTALLTNRKHLTIQVDPKKRAIIQARGLANRLMRPQEREIIGRWAKDNALRVSV